MASQTSLSIILMDDLDFLFSIYGKNDPISSNKMVKIGLVINGDLASLIILFVFNDIHFLS